MLDKLNEERARGITINLSLGKIETPKYVVTIIDAPGHRGFTKHTIPGIQMADYAILVVAGGAGEFEAGLSCATLKHADLASVLGVKNLIVAVNKFDQSINGESRFEEVNAEMKKRLLKRRFRNVPIIPISAFWGYNLTELSSEIDWFRGWRNPKTGRRITNIIDAIDQFRAPRMQPNRPFRLPINVSLLYNDILTLIIESSPDRWSWHCGDWTCGLRDVETWNGLDYRPVRSDHRGGLNRNASRVD